MANYFLYVLSADAATREILRKADSAGAEIAEAIQDFSTQKTTGFPSKPDGYLSKHFDQNPPTPKAIIVGGREIGKVLGRYYDGDPVGFKTLPVKIPSGYYVFTPIDYDTTTDGFSSPDSLMAQSGQYIIDAMDEFDSNPDDDDMISAERSLPVFVNRSGEDVDFFIIKRTPFREEDAHLLQNNAGPYNMPPDYKPPRVA